MEWIDVNERLPRHHKSVLMFDSDTDMMVGYYDSKIQLWQGEYNEYVYDKATKVTHWMPLPEPPKNDFKE